MFTMVNRSVCVGLLGLLLLGLQTDAQNSTSSPDLGVGNLNVGDNMTAQVLQLLSSTLGSTNGTSSLQLPKNLAEEKTSPELVASQRPSGGSGDFGSNIQSLLGQLLAASASALPPAKPSTATKQAPVHATSDVNNQEIQVLLHQLLAKLSNRGDTATSASEISSVSAAAPVATATASASSGTGTFDGLLGQLFSVEPFTGISATPLVIASDAAGAKSVSAGMGIDTPFGSVSKTATVTTTEDIRAKLTSLYAFLEKTILGLGTISAIIYFFAALDIAFAEARGGIAKKREWLLEKTGGATAEIAESVANAIAKNF